MTWKMKNIKQNNPHDQTRKSEENIAVRKGSLSLSTTSASSLSTRATFGFVCHAEYKKTSLGSVVCPSTQLRAIILAETVLAEASATMSAGQGCEGIKTLSTQKVATARTKAYRKINSDEKVAVWTARNAMKEGTHDLDLHAHGNVCLKVLSKSVEKLNGLKDISEELFGNDPNALRAMPIFTARTYRSLEFVGYVLPAYVLECAVKKHALRFMEDCNDVLALANIDVEAASLCGLCGLSIVRGENLTIHTQTAIACEIIKKKLPMENEVNKKKRPTYAREKLGRIVKDQELLRSLTLLLQTLELCWARRRCHFSFEQVAAS